MQGELTDSELRWLAGQGLGPDDVFDARRLPQWLWFKRIDETDKTIALGSRCPKAGHRLRSRRGHCVQCDPKKLAFQARYRADQYVYIAGSLSERLIKIGTCRDCNQREQQLRNEGYGGASDWRIIYYIKLRNAGAMEDRARLRLSAYWVSRPYWKDGSRQIGTELLRCSFSGALDALTEVAEGSTLGLTWKSRHTIEYEFGELEETA
jgi:hypothetical protein